MNNYRLMGHKLIQFNYMHRVFACFTRLMSAQLVIYIIIPMTQIMHLLCVCNFYEAILKAYSLLFPLLFLVRIGYR